MIARIALVAPAIVSAASATGASEASTSIPEAPLCCTMNPISSAPSMKLMGVSTTPALRPKDRHPVLPTVVAEDGEAIPLLQATRAHPDRRPVHGRVELTKGELDPLVLHGELVRVSQR
jgi:hypothetical protein